MTKEPKWLEDKVKARFDYEIKSLPNGLRVTILRSKKRKP